MRHKVFYETQIPLAAVFRGVALVMAADLTVRVGLPAWAAIAACFAVLLVTFVVTGPTTDDDRS